MRNKIILFCFTVVASLLVACSENPKVKATFIGTIEEIHSSGTATVSELETNDNKRLGLVVIDLPANAAEPFQIGDKVKVGYDGSTLELAPVRISTITLEKVE